MKGDLISCNGKIIKPEEVALSTDYIMSVNFVYQKIHALAHKPLYSHAHAELLETSFSILYGLNTGLSAGMIEEEVEALLTANRYPAGSVQITIYIIPDENGTGKPTRIISCEKQLLYKGYTLWHTAEKAVVLPYECPFRHFKTAASLSAHTYAASYARGKGANCIISENPDGTLYSAGETPLFAVIGKTIITPGIGDGACDSIERRLGMIAAGNAGFNLEENPIHHTALNEYQELFTVTTGGVTSIGECDGNIYSHSTAGKVAAEMDRLRVKKL